MQLDDFKQAWAAHTAAMQRSVAINERLLREVMLGKVRSSLAPYIALRVIEVVLGAAALLATARVLAVHLDEPRYLAVGGALFAFAVVMTAMCAHLLARSAQLDYHGPVTAIQRAVEQLQRSEYRVFKWALLGGITMWLPALLVLFEAVTGVDALARVDLAYLLANLALGAVVVVLGQLLARRHVERPGLGPRARRIVEALSGRSLRRATGHLGELARFERDGDER